MKVLNKRELQQIVFNHSSDNDFQDFMNLYKKFITKSYSFLVIDILDIILIIMAIDDKIKDEKLQYDINREAAKTSALSYGKIYKYEYLTDEEILLSDQTRIIEHVKC